MIQAKKIRKIKIKSRLLNLKSPCDGPIYCDMLKVLLKMTFCHEIHVFQRIFAIFMS